MDCILLLLLIIFIFCVVRSGSLPTDFLDDSDNEVFDAKLESSKRD